MLCEHANPQLVEYAAKELPPSLQLQVEEHLSGCDTCQADFAAIGQLRTMAANWHDEVAPAWQPPRIPGRDYLENLRLWFPTFASTAALAVVAVMFVQMPASNGTLPVNQSANADGYYANLPALPQATQAAMVQSVMDGSRVQRQEELQALLKILKNEMDRRSIETEDSLRYVITHQLQGQQELDDLYQQVEALMLTPEQASTLNPQPGNADAQEISP